MNCSLNVSANQSSSKVNPNTSRLAIPKSGSHANSKGVTPKYGVQPKFLNNSANLNKNNLTKSEDKNQQKSVGVPRRNSPRLKTKEAATVNDGATKKGISGLKGPITKLSLMKPGEMQKRNNKTIIGNGPMKAVQPIDAINSTVLIKKGKSINIYLKSIIHLSNQHNVLEFTDISTISDTTNLVYYSYMNFHYVKIIRQFGCFTENLLTRETIWSPVNNPNI